MLQAETSFLKRLFDLREGAQEKQTIIDNVKDDTEFSSARVWTLVFAIGLASVGLNMNSIPVIIGAMLISPLMGPIVSIGLSLAIDDWDLMRRSAKNLVIQTLISIVISSIYFALSPITNAQSELLSRIQPTMFDVLIAVFGGMAGFIGISRARQTNIVPGVAIATALMPPLCTVGYGIGTWQPQFIIGAFYLFLINSIFICLSSVVVSRYLKLPKKTYVDAGRERKIHRIITVVIIAIIIPAVYQGIVLVRNNNFNLSADRYIKTVFEDAGYVVVYKNVSYVQSEKKIELAFLAARVTEEEKEQLENRLKDFGLEGTELIIRQNRFALTEEEWRRVVEDTENDEKRMELLEQQLTSRITTLVAPEQLLKELQALDPTIVDVAIGTVSQQLENIDQEKIAVLVYYTAPENEEKDTELLRNWLKQRLGSEEIEAIFIRR